MIASDGELAQLYPPGTIDVVAPGTNLASLSSGGPVQVSSAQYAVAFVAGAVALIRGKSPYLGAEEVIAQIRAAGTPPKTSVGTGQPAVALAPLINLARALGLLTSAPPNPSSASDTGGGTTAVMVVIAALAVLAARGLLVMGRERRPAEGSPHGPSAEGSTGLVEDVETAPERRACGTGDLSTPVPRCNRYRSQWIPCAVSPVTLLNVERFTTVVVRGVRTSGIGGRRGHAASTMVWPPILAFAARGVLAGCLAS